MARPLRIEYQGAFYHITSSGNEKRELFTNNNDREKFFSYCETASERYGAVIHACCLMSNHYHLLLETPLGNLSQIMRHLNGAYTAYFNNKHQRSGHLFQGRYQAIVVDSDEYAAELSRYIHLNPVRAGIVNSPGEYPWSSYQYYAGKRKKPEWLELDFVFSYFGKSTSLARKRYRQFVNSLIGQEYESPLRMTVASTILGGIDFIEEIKAKYLDGRKTDRNLPALTKLRKGLSIGEVEKKAKAVFGEEPIMARKAAIYICHKYSGMLLKEIGVHFGISESAVSQSSRRFQLLLDKSNKAKRKLKQIKRGMCLSKV